MDFNTALNTSQAPTPAPVILARNIQRFFKEKSEQLKGGGSPSSNGKFGKSHHSDLDVDTVLQDVDCILDGRSLEDGHLLLRGMVADLLREVDLLRWRLEETTASLQRVREERDVVNNDYRDCLLSLILALQQAVGDEMAPNRSLLQSGQLLTANEATTLTITTLTGKIEKLNLEAAEKEAELSKAKGRIEDLESENASKIHKIAALEKQFLSINKKRNKVVDSKSKQQQQQKQLLVQPKLVDSTNKTASPPPPFDAGNVSAIKKVPINAAWNGSANPIKIPINALWNGSASTTVKPEIKEDVPAIDAAPEENIVIEEEPETIATQDGASSNANSADTTGSVVVEPEQDIAVAMAPSKPSSRTKTSAKNTSTNISVSSKPKRKGHVMRLVKLVDEI